MKTSKTHANEANFAPPAWVIIKDGYLLRFAGKREAGVYFDNMEGSVAIYELYNIKSDPRELNNLAEEQPEKVKELAKLYFSEAMDIPPPAQWDKGKWEELKESEKLFDRID